MIEGIPARSSIAMPIGLRRRKGAKLSQEDRDTERRWHRDHHRDERRDDRAIDRRHRAEFLGDGIPGFVVKKVQAERLDGRHRTDDQRSDHAAKEEQNRPGRCQGQKMKRNVAKFETGESFA